MAVYFLWSSRISNVSSGSCRTRDGYSSSVHCCCCCCRCLRFLTARTQTDSASTHRNRHQLHQCLSATRRPVIIRDVAHTENQCWATPGVRYWLPDSGVASYMQRRVSLNYTSTLLSPLCNDCRYQRLSEMLHAVSAVWRISRPNYWMLFSAMLERLFGRSAPVFLLYSAELVQLTSLTTAADSLVTPIMFIEMQPSTAKMIQCNK